MNNPQLPTQVTLVATPDTQVAPLSGLYETLNSFPLLGGIEEDLPQQPLRSADEVCVQGYPDSGGSRFRSDVLAADRGLQLRRHHRWGLTATVS